MKTRTPVEILEDLKDAVEDALDGHENATRLRRLCNEATDAVNVLDAVADVEASLAHLEQLVLNFEGGAR